MKKIISVAAMALVLTGCTITPEGAYFAMPSPGLTGAQVNAKWREQFRSNAQSALLKKGADAAGKNNIPGLLVVGNVKALYKFGESEKDVDDLYRGYSQHAGKYGDEKPVLSREEFRNTFVAVSRVEFMSIPLLFNRWTPLILTKKDLEDVYFPSALSVGYLDKDGDLIVGRHNADSSLVLHKILCKQKSPDYSACAARYQKGLYDQVTGYEVDASGREVPNGKRVDLETFLPIK